MKLGFVRFLTPVAMAAALVVSARAGLGPFLVGALRFASPMGMESVFAAAFLAVVLLRASSGSSIGGAVASAKSGWPVWGALAIVAAAYLPSLRDPFLSDDYILVSRATLDPARVLAVFHAPGGDGSFRPLGYLYYALLHQFGGVDSWKWHACALCVHLINCALLYLMVRALWPDSFLAFTAAVLFGWNGTRPEAVAWTAGNFDLLACLFVLAATLAILRGRVALAVPLLVLGILSKESAYAAPAVIFGFAAAAGRLREARIRHGLIASITVCAAMLAYRWSLFHGPGGYIDPSTGQAQVLSFHLGSALKAVFLRVWANLFFPVNWDASASSWVLCAAVLAGAVALLFSAAIPRRVALSAMALTIGGVLPAYHLALIGDNLNGSRILYLPAIGFCVLCAHLMRGQRVAAVVLMLSTGLMLLHNLDAWHRNSVLADQVCAGATTQAPVHDLNGVVFFANGYQECMQMHHH